MAKIRLINDDPKKNCLDCNAEESPEAIYYHSILSVEGKGAVHFAWGPARAQFSPEETRVFALQLLEAAEAAEGDQIVWRLLTEAIGIEPQNAVQVVGNLRQYRNKKD